MDFVDSNYEFNAPQYVDFLNEVDDKNIDKWFDEHPGHEGGIRLSMVPFVQKPSDFQSVTQAITAALHDQVGTATKAPAAAQIAEPLPEVCQLVQECKTQAATTPSSTQEPRNVLSLGNQDTDTMPMEHENTKIAEKETTPSSTQGTRPPNLVLSWDKSDTEPQPKKETKLKRSRSVERPNMRKRKSSQERKTKDDQECSASAIKKSKMEIKKPMLTIAHTPELLRRTQVKKAPNVLSSEEAELAKVKQLKEEAAKLKRRSEVSYKKAIAAGPYMPIRSQVEVTHPVDFSFATDGRLKSQGATSHKETYEKGFENQLRQHPPSPSFKNRKVTKPVPFHFTNPDAKKELPKIQKWESMASSVSHFQTKTPERGFFRTKFKVLHNIFKFRTLSAKSKVVAALPDKRTEVKLTNPKTPLLTTKSRTRPVTVQSHAQEEEKIIQDMKSYKFKAREFDPRIIDHGGIIGLPQKKEQAPTDPRPFEFMSDARLEARKKKDDKCKEKDSQNNKTDRKRTTTGPSQKTVKEKCTRVAPFSFDQRDKELKMKKEKKIQEVLEEEQKAREFHAQPLPNLSPDIVIHHDHKKTELKPFHLEGEKRHVLSEQKWQEQLNRQLEDEKAKQIFKAKPSVVTHKAPFVPLKGQIPPTEISSFKLNTEERAVKREEFDDKIKEYQRLIKEDLDARKMREEMEVEEEINRIRQQAVPKANPIRKYKPVDVHPSERPLTDPKTPYFETDKRCRRLLRN